MNKLFIFVLLFAVLIPVTFADTLILHNGREIEGKIESEDENEVKMDIGIGVVGFPKTQIAEIKRASDDEQQELEDKLEQRRKEAAQTAAENEKWVEKQEKRQELISTRKEQTKQDIQSRREEILQKRREQLQKLREQRTQAASQPEQAVSSGDQTAPPPPPPVPTFDRGAEPVGLSTPESPAQSDSNEQATEEKESRGSKRIHRLGDKDR